MKVALVYDRVNKWGGAERVILALHELFPDAPLYTSVYNEQKATWAKNIRVIPSFLQNFPLAKDTHEFYPLLMPVAFESFNFDDYDLVISVTSEAAKGIITRPRTLHLCYCLTPTRYLWSGYEHYFQNRFIRALAYPATFYLREWDKVASARPDFFIAISSEVKDRIKKYYNREAHLIYPPVELFERYPFQQSNDKKSEYYLVVSRLVSYKRIDLAIEACNRLQLPLKIVGVGNQMQKLQAMAGPTVEFLGSVSDAELALLYQHCKALIFPGFEDFGMVMVEALGFGKPVIAYHKGGSQDIIVNKESGIFFESQRVDSLMDAIIKSQTINFNPQDLRRRAKKFSKSEFKKKIKDYIEQSLQKSKIAL